MSSTPSYSNIAALNEKLGALPTRPGCYLYKDANGQIIYVGKAINLRNRVRSYFQKGASLAPKTRRLVQAIRDLDYIVVESELEALVLECNLIKKYQPHYNVRLRDDKNYPYLCATTAISTSGRIPPAAPSTQRWTSSSGSFPSCPAASRSMAAPSRSRASIITWASAWRRAPGWRTSENTPRP